MNKRLRHINRLLSEYALGRFENTLPISSRLDEIDAICTGINMLAEELKATTISRNYFTNIFNAVSDMVFVVNRTGRILEMNRAAVQRLSPAGIAGTPRRTLPACLGQTAAWYRMLRGRLAETGTLTMDNLELSLPKGRHLPVDISASTFPGNHGQELYLFTAADTSYRVQTENLVLRAIIDTQERERRRLAQDLHDSVTQQLSGIKFAVSSLLAGTKDRKQQQVLQQSGTGLARLIAELRSVCFNLMPRTLEEFGLVQAIREFHTQALFNRKMDLVIHETAPLPVLDPELAVDLYRIVQEFMANAFRHGNATKVGIHFESQTGQLRIRLQDNGCGFDKGQHAEGMGLQNVRSRLRSHGAALKITTGPGKGVRFEMKVPLNQPI